MDIISFEELEASARRAFTGMAIDSFRQVGGIYLRRTGEDGWCLCDLRGEPFPGAAMGGLDLWMERFASVPISAHLDAVRIEREACAKVAETANLDGSIDVHTPASGTLCSAHTPWIIAQRIRDRR